jgi:hypothetical protein
MFELPGSDTCLRIGGNIIGDVTAPDFKTLEIASRAKLMVNTATATASGALRSSVVLTLKGNQKVTTPDDEIEGSSTVSNASLSQAFISFHGLTVGRTRSFFDAPSLGLPMRSVSSSKFNDLAGFELFLSPWIKLGVSAEGATARESRLVLGTTAGRRSQAPDLVGRIGYDDGALQMQASGAVRFLAWDTPVPQADTGYAVQASVSYRFGGILSPMQRFDGIAPEALPSVSLSAAIGRGASSYLGFGADVPDSWCLNGACGLSEGWSMAAELLVPFGEAWSGGVSASYGVVDPAPGTARYAEWRLGANIGYQANAALKLGLDATLRGQSGVSFGIARRAEFQPRLRIQTDF